MAVTYNATVKTNRMTQVLNAIDAGAAAGFLEILTSDELTVLATITLADPCGSVSGSTLSFTMPKSDTSADATGTAAKARIKDSAGTIVISGLTVGTTGSDINLNSTSIAAGQTVELTSASITHG